MTALRISVQLPGTEMVVEGGGRGEKFEDS